MLAHLAIISSFDAEAWQSPVLLDKCLMAILLLGVIAGCLANGEPEDPTDF